MAEKKKAAPSAAPSPAGDKKKALETAIAQIEKNYGKGAIMRLGDDIPVNVEAISTGSLSLDLALGIGGVPRGRIVEIYGPESCGKTTLALHVVASAQKNGGEAAYIDVRTPALTAQLTRLSYRIDLHLDPEAPVSADEVRRAIDTLRAGHGIDYARGKKSKRLDLDHTLVGYELTAGERPGHLVLMLDTHADNEGSMRPEILLSATDVLLQGLTPGVDAPIVSTGMQDLVTICSYDVERQNQACEDDEGRLVSPIPVRTCGFAPHTR